MLPRAAYCDPTCSSTLASCPHFSICVAQPHHKHTWNKTWWSQLVQRAPRSCRGAMAGTANFCTRQVSVPMDNGARLFHHHRCEPRQNESSVRYVHHGQANASWPSDLLEKKSTVQPSRLKPMPCCRAPDPCMGKEKDSGLQGSEDGLGKKRRHSGGHRKSTSVRCGSGTG